MKLFKETDNSYKKNIIDSDNRYYDIGVLIILQ